MIQNSVINSSELQITKNSLDNLSRVNQLSLFKPAAEIERGSSWELPNVLLFMAVILGWWTTCQKIWANMSAIVTEFSPSLEQTFENMYIILTNKIFYVNPTPVC